MLPFLLIKFAVIVLSYTSIVYGLQFLESPEEFLILPEDTELSLTCRADSETAVIKWYYQQTADGQRWFLFEAETLRYPSVQTSYQGFYSCEAVEGPSTIQSNITDLRIAFIEERFLKVPSQVYTVEGSTVEFECEPPSSYPPANVTWHKDDILLSNARSYVTPNYTLIIVGTLPEDSGNYQCFAVNEVTGTVRSSLEGELYVTQQTDNDVDDNSEKPEPSIASYFTRVDEGQSTSLLCAFQGVPYPTYSWQFANDTQVDDSDERFLYQYDRQVLQIITATRDMTGLFKCKGTNVAGSSVINVTLFVYYIEELGFAENIPELLTFELNEEGDTSVECVGLGSPPLLTSWYGEDEALLSASSFLTIDTSKLQNLEVECRVSNENGQVFQRTNIVVKEPQKEFEDVSATIKCYTDKMTLTLSEAAEVDSFHLNDRGCSFLGDEIEIDTPLDGCDTRIYYNDTHVVYKNQLFGVTIGESSDVISRGDGFEIAFECAYKKTGNTDDIAWEARGQIRVAVKGIGEFSFSLDLYNDANFTDKINSSQYPVRLSLKENIYMEVTLITPGDELSLLVSDIKASDSPSGEAGSFTYSLVQNGCIVDSTFQYMDVEQRKTKRFTLKAFHFMSTHSVVYLHAYVKICNDSVENCSQSCAVNKRSIRSAETSEKYHIFQGPFVNQFQNAPLRVVSGTLGLSFVARPAIAFLIVALVT